MNRSVFQFKQFAIGQSGAAMKVGTDGVLLGAWTAVDHRPYKVLDVGAGTGVVALMLAQRSDAPQIDALEIDTGAYEQCVENFEQSPWNDRLFCYHAGFDEFVEEMDETYDLIVSNPPFFTEEHPSADERRAMARTNFSLPFAELIPGVSQLLSADGRFSMIAPFREEASLLELAAVCGLFPVRICRVRGHADAGIKRVLLEFSREQLDPLISELVIETARHQYTPEYIALTREFYLKM